MNLSAYLQIDDLDGIARANGIEIPRLRGYSLMSEEEPYTKEEIADALKSAELDACSDGCFTSPRFTFLRDGSIYELSPATRRAERKFMIKEAADDYHNKYLPYSMAVGFRWDLLHGKRRKNLKFEIKKRKKATIAQMEAWNRYAGRNDVLFIHARIGGGNWDYFGGPELVKQPWFLEKVDDSFDSTYCDIYAKIEPVTQEVPEGLS